MKQRNTGSADEELELYEDVHRIEEEIDLFLERKKRESDLIIKKAGQESESYRIETAREVHEEKERLREQLISEAEKEAEKIQDNGITAAEKAAAHFDEIRAAVIGKIMEYLLGGN